MLDEKAIKVFFVSGKVAKWWNARRSDKTSEVCLLGGWYWTHQGMEQGPFRTPSGAERDAYYRVVLRQQPPILDAPGVDAAEHELRTEAKTARARAKAAIRRSIRDERRV
jgi:hypothetical protein